MNYPFKSIYLAGPITGLSYEDATNGWRKQFTKMMPNHIICFSPMRGKKYLKKETELDGRPDSYRTHAMATAKGITTRDRNDVKNTDLMVVNFQNTERVSIGTCVEFGWADAFRKPLIMITDENDQIHNHIMLHEIAGYIVYSLEEAAELAIALLTPGVS